MRQDIPFRDRKVPVTKKLAEEILSLPITPWERNLQEDNVNKLVHELKLGRFRWECVTLVVMICGGKRFRGNGQHVCWMILEKLSPKDYEGQFVTLRTYEVDDDEEMRALYSTFDVHYVRSVGQQAVALMLGTPQMSGIGGSNLKLLVSGYRQAVWPDSKEAKKHTVSEVADKLLYHEAGICKLMLETIGTRGRERKHVYRGPVIAAMFLTFRRAQEDSQRFWRAVADGVGLESSDPRLKLRNYLVLHSVSVGAGSKANTAPVSPEIMLRHCLIAWRAFREGRKIQNIHVEGGKKRPAVA